MSFCKSNFSPTLLPKQTRACHASYRQKKQPPDNSHGIGAHFLSPHFLTPHSYLNFFIHSSPNPQRFFISTQTRHPLKTLSLSRSTRPHMQILSFHMIRNFGVFA